MSHTLLIRADASVQIGTGHVMRCLALAQAWRAHGGRAFLATASLGVSLAKRITAAGLELLPYPAMELGSAADAEACSALAQELDADWLVADGYHFGDLFQASIRGPRLLLIDDYGHAKHYSADLLLNQNIYAEARLYPNRAAHTRLLLGTRYALLRREFWAWRGHARTIAPRGRRILVTLGGADPENVTQVVIEALGLLADIEATVVIGANNPNANRLRAATRDTQALRLVSNVEDMPGLMAWADIAISASGSTCWELAFMGLPALVVEIADNQRPVAAGLSRYGSAHSLGWYTALSPEGIAAALTDLIHDPKRREAMARAGRELVDGRGGERVVRAMLNQGLQLRQVSEADARMLWEWVNEPAVRRSAFRSALIPWEDHVRWFTSKLADPACVQYIALNDEGKPVGQIRFDLDGVEAVVDLSLAASSRGRGYGPEIIRLGVAKLAREVGITTVHALVKVENEPSIRSFLSAGFERVREEAHYGCPTLHLIWRGTND